MAIKTLDALVLASLPEGPQIQRLAALWCRAYRDRYPLSKDEVMKWVDVEFGPVIDAERRAQIERKLLDEVKRQIRVRGRRRDVAKKFDPLTEEFGADARVGALLQSRLGPARSWVSQRRLANPSVCSYIDSGFFSGLVAGLIPVEMKLRRITNPCLLVYRQGFQEPRSYWVPGYITSVPEAFIWLIPPEAAEFLQLEGTRVEHDGEAQAVRLITQFGSKTLPWRKL